ncbi:efflux RND transporter periplasmic adaptor subunit [Lederbergia ruris]|uniref:efflux RND transporter periplasmic adaptor subunit n=1 Tax=Lederbergia ruris TaxID=217495 RepID=UPI00178711B0|nr:efflux RND transporter periplasmic adaptor subunit [Lederbergia ruris]
MSIKKMRILYRNNRVSFNTSFITLLLILLSGCTFLPKEEAVLAPPLTEPAQLDYKTVEVKKGEIIKSVKGLGTMVPKNNVDLFYKKEGGRLKEIKVHNGDAIKEGQVLAVLDTGGLAYDIEQARLELQKAEIRLQQVRAQEGGSTYDIQLAELDVQAGKNHLARLNNEMAEATITSPINGVVTFVAELNQGAVVPAYESIFQVAEVTDLKLQYSANKAADLSDVEIGMKVTLEIDGEKVSGEVVQTPKTVPSDVSQKDPEFYGRTVMIDIKKMPKDSKVGDMIDFEIITAKQKDTLIIPKNALRSITGRNYVQLIEGNTKREVDIQTGIVTSTEVEVLKGLEEGDQIITK